MNKTEEEVLVLWQRKGLRKVHGSIKESQLWRRGSNQKLEEMYRQPKLARYASGSAAIKVLGTCVQNAGNKSAKNCVKERCRCKKEEKVIKKAPVAFCKRKCWENRYG